jgi:Protein of unknown function (DUF3137)
MFNIDFWTLPENTKKKLAPEEITTLNWLFQDPTIQKQLEDIELQRKLRQKWKYVIYGWCTILAIGLSLLFGGGSIISGFFYTIGTGDNSFSPVIWSTIISYSIGMGMLYKKFSTKIEIPLKTEVLMRMCPLLYSKLEYSHDGKYSFDELDVLRQKEFLASYTSLDRVEDSIHFDIEKDGKQFSVNGFELETSEMRWSGKNRKRVTTNHCYLMKAVFPNARIPLSSDLFIVRDQLDAPVTTKLLIPCMLAIFAFIFSFVFSQMLSVGIGVWLLVWGGVYFFQNRNQSKNRVQLENMEFEKMFDVKCEDQVTSRMIITPAFMDRIVSFVHKTGNQYEFLMQGNTLYIKRHIVGAYLEAGTEKNMLNNVTWFTQFYTDMREIIQFTYDMNLMYLSKTDTTQSTWAEPISSPITPIIFTKTTDNKLSSLTALFSNTILRT